MATLTKVFVHKRMIVIQYTVNEQLNVICLVTILVDVLP